MLLTFITALVLYLTGGGQTAPTTPTHTHGGNGKPRAACVVQQENGDCD